MGNEFANKPDLEEGFPKFPVTWLDPVTGLLVPKDPGANLRYRAELLEQAENDELLQTDLYTACSQSLLFFVNVFAFTLRVFETGDDGKSKQAAHRHLPFLTWPIQDKHLLWLENKLDEGEEGLTDKSRDMGATWNHLVTLLHRFLFRSSESHLMISRKEDAVDILDGMPRNYPHGAVADPGTLFGKIDYMLRFLPEWMLPRMGRKKLHLVNLDNGSRIDGESANATAGSSDRRTSLFLDEMAKMKEAESIKRSTRDVAACRLVCSTPDGAGTAYSKWRLSGQIAVFVLPWWEHPEKGADRYVAQDDMGRWKIRSPWYDIQEEERSPKELAIEVDMDHVGSGDTFFEPLIIEQHRRLFAKPPIRTVKLAFTDDMNEEEVRTAVQKKDADAVRISPVGPWKLWTHLIKRRPDQTKTYVLGVDIGKGMGASNSTVSIMCKETGEKIVSYADANTPPYEFAKIVLAAWVWCGGKEPPLLIWENNGDPGFDFGRLVAYTYRCPNIYFDRQPGSLTEKRGKRYGWRSSPEKKAAALGLLRRGYAHGKIINHDDEALVEALSYIHYENGGIGPATLVAESDSARKTHGDRVIADMLCLVAVETLPFMKKTAIDAPHRTFAHRLTRFQKRKNADPRKTFDFARSDHA